MRPTGIEALRGIQVALAEQITPELQSVFGQDVAQMLQMLGESLAAEWDTAVDDLSRDIRTVIGLLETARDAIGAAPARNELLASLVPEIVAVLAEPAPESLAITALTARHDRLNGVLEKVICALEDVAGDTGYAVLMPVRQAIYAHLRQVCLRGWSFWDMASFRESVARAKAGAA